jgi:tetratricopeptide (TPR) repeat protein
MIALGAKFRLIPPRMDNPTPNSSAKAARARSLCEKGSWAEVLALAEGWRAESPGDAKAWFYHGAALAATGRFVEAETAYRHALALDATDVKAWNNLAKVLFEGLKRPAKAVKCLQRLLEIDSRNKLAWANLASLYGQLGRHKEALACAERALAIDPHMVLAQLIRARAAQGLGRPEILREASALLAQLPPEKFSRAT